MAKTPGYLFGTLILIVLIFFTASAQSSAPVVREYAEYEIGVDCPVGQALEPGGEVLWVLMEGCFSGQYSLRAYNTADGTLLTEEDAFAGELAPLKNGYVDSYVNPLAFSGGLFSIRYYDTETFMPLSLYISLEGVYTPAVSDEVLTEMLLRYTPYPETANYSQNHELAAAVGIDALTVLNVITGEVLLSLPVAADSYNAFPSFAPDGRTLYVAVLDDYEDMTNYNSTVSIYELNDGTLTGSFAAPSFILWPSPDGRYAAINWQSNDSEVSELSVINIETGELSEAISLYEPGRQLLRCANDGHDMSDTDVRVDGHFSAGGVSWLPDSSGFLIARSYGGDALGGGRPCALDTSRLNHYTVAGPG